MKEKLKQIIPKLEWISNRAHYAYANIENKYIIRAFDGEVKSISIKNAIKDKEFFYITDVDELVDCIFKSCKSEEEVELQKLESILNKLL